MAKGISVLLILWIFAALAVSSQQAGLAQQPVTRKQSQRGLAHMCSFPTTRPGGSSRAPPEWKEHRGMQPVLLVGVPEESDQVVFFKLNGQKDVARRRDGK